MGMVLAHIRQRLPDDAIITNGAGNFAVWPSKFLKYGKKARLLAPQSGAMGYGIPAAVAAKAAAPDRFVLCFAGDGDFQMNGNELGTAMQSGLQPVILVINNGSYGTIRMHQEREYPARVSGTELVNPDFVTLAKAYGFYGERVENTADFAGAFERARESNTGALLELVLATEAITPRQTIGDLQDLVTVSTAIELRRMGAVSMSFNFDEFINRIGTHSSKWDNMQARYGVAPDDGLAMWVADMDFRPTRSRGNLGWST